jgi:hydroxymethylglutaryl-CoA synthase
VARGIIGWGAYVPYRRLDRTTIAPVAGAGGGRGTRSVASYDEDATTMAVEAARVALRSAPDVEPSTLWFATTSPPYLDKTNATAVHAALRLRRSVPAFDAGGAVRSSMGAFRAAFHDVAASLVVASDVRTGLPGSADESAFGDGAAALLVGEGDVVAELLAWGAATEEFVDRWRTPGDVRSKTWEERFGETRYSALGVEAWEAALKQAGIAAGDVDHLVVTSTHDRATKAVAKKLGVAPDRLVDDLASSIGNTGAAAPALLLASALEQARPGQVIGLVVLADGADAVVFRTTASLAERPGLRPVAAQVAAGGAVAYGKYLAWRGLLPVQPPNRPEPARPSSSAAGRSTDWKYGFVGSERADGSVHLPPSPHDDTARPMSEATGTIVTFTIDKLAYSPSPPVVFAVVDFEGGGRLPVELTDVDPDEMSIGAEVEMTFRKLFTADGIHNYFWKARLVR